MRWLTLQEVHVNVLFKRELYDASLQFRLAKALLFQPQVMCNVSASFLSEAFIAYITRTGLTEDLQQRGNSTLCFSALLPGRA